MACRLWQQRDLILTSGLGAFWGEKASKGCGRPLNSVGCLRYTPGVHVWLQIGTGGYGWALLQALTALCAIGLLAWLVLRLTVHAPFGFRASVGGRHMTLIEQLPLDTRRSLHLVKVADRVLLIGTGDGGQPVTLAEFDEGTVDLAPPELVQTMPFRGFLETWLKGNKE